MVKNHTELLVWQKAMDLVEEIYRITQDFPADERYGITAQIRRAAVSIPSNIAEGHARQTTREFLQFIAIARGSLAELQTQLEICVRIQLANQSQIDRSKQFAIEIGKMFTSLRKSLSNRL